MLLCLTIPIKVLTESLGATHTLTIGDHILNLLNTPAPNESITIDSTSHIRTHLSTVSLLIVVKAHRSSIGNSTRFPTDLTGLASIRPTHIVGHITMTRGQTSSGGTEYIGCNSTNGPFGASLVGIRITDAFLGVDMTYESILALIIGGAWARKHGILGEDANIVIGGQGGVITGDLGFILFIYLIRIHFHVFIIAGIHNLAGVAFTIVTETTFLGCGIAFHMRWPECRCIVGVGA
jgi:hypothetical protein